MVGQKVLGKQMIRRPLSMGKETAMLDLANTLRMHFPGMPIDAYARWSSRLAGDRQSLYGGSYGWKTWDSPVYGITNPEEFKYLRSPWHNRIFRVICEDNDYIYGILFELHDNLNFISKSKLLTFDNYEEARNTLNFNCLSDARNKAC